MAGRCAYVGSRGQGPVLVVDIGDPAHPRVSGTIPARAATTTRELRAIPDERLLVVMSYALARGGANRFDLYRWSGDDCAHPEPAGHYDFGARTPHEFYLWHTSRRTLLYTAMFSGAAGDLQVIDITDPGAPRLAGAWSPPGGLLHSIALSDDGRRAFLSLWTGGMAVADPADFTDGAPEPRLRLLTAPAGLLPALPGGNVHSAVPVPGRDLAVLTDERYPPACPYGPARAVDVADPARPRVLATLAAPENSLESCLAAPAGPYTSHNPTLTPGLALVSWYGSGLQVFDIADPARPVRLAEYRGAATQPGARDPQLGVAAPLTWSYPVIRDGLIYVTDINQGLLVLRYRGPHQAELSGLALAEGNSNLRVVSVPQATATPPMPAQVPLPGPSPTPVARTAAAAAPHPGEPGRSRLILAGLVFVALVVGAAALRRLYQKLY